MDYLSKVWNELKKTTWEKPRQAIKETLIVVIAMICIALFYFGYDWLMQAGINKWL